MSAAVNFPTSIDSAARPVRVIVVGRTALSGIDAILRKEPSVELIRARNAFAAIGEAASPIDAESPRDLSVIVSPEALPAQRAAAFASAIRRIDPRARLLFVGERAPEGFDSGLIAGSDAGALLAHVRHAHPVAPPTATPQSPPPPPADEAVPTPAAPASTAPAVAPKPGIDALAPAIALATGHDAVAAALESLKRRWNLESARVLPAEGEGDAAGWPIAFNGRPVARLVVHPALPEAAIAGEAAAIAPWVVLARQQEQLRRAAFTDELTGAWNRRYFNRFLSAAIADATQKRHTVTLLVFDIDNFKSYNDRFGHSAGDEILVEAVRLLNGSIRATDRVCRIGGDEFAVIFHDPAGPRGATATPGASGGGGGGGGATSPQSISEVVRRFQRAICDHRFPKLAEMAPGTLTISGGLTTFPWDGRTVQQLLDKADALALRSKQEGKNKIALGPGAEQVCGQ